MLGLILALTLSTGYKSGSAAWQDFNKYADDLYQQMTANGAKFDQTGFEAKIKVKAQDMVKGLDANKMDVTGATDWANLFGEADDLGSASTILKRYIKAQPGATDLGSATITLGGIYVQQGKIKDAEKIAFSGTTALTKTGADYAGLDAQIAQYYQDKNKEKEAVSFLKKAMDSPTIKGSRGASMLQGQLTQLTMIGTPETELAWLPQHYGDFTSLAALKGQVVVLDFFAHWCGPCKASMPEMRKITDQYPALKVIGVTAYYGTFEGKKATQDEEYADMKGFMDKYQIDHPVAYVKNSEMLKYGVTGIPEFVLIGKDGLIKKLQVGYGPGALDGFTKAIAAELAK